MDLLLTEVGILDYLDNAIQRWRNIRDGKVEASREQVKEADAYIDAFQSVRKSLFGDVLE